MIIRVISEVYKIMRGVGRINSQNHFPWARESRTQEHMFNVRAERFNRDQTGTFHTEGGSIRNELPEVVIKPDTITILKRHLDKYLDGKGVEGYEPNAGEWDSVV